MIFKPMVRNNICINCHPAGCAAEVARQIREAKAARAQKPAADGSAPRVVLVIGGSTGYGLASRIVAAFGYGAETWSVAYEKEPTDTKVGTPGWYNDATFLEAAKLSGLEARSFNGDAFSTTLKSELIAKAAERGIRFDLIVYSLASPVRIDPATGVMHRSVIKSLGEPYRGMTVDVFTGKLSEAEFQPASPEEAADTVKVMGGEDWMLWIKALEQAGLLAKGAITIAYSYIGPPRTWPIYRDGTIGAAKADMERTAEALRTNYANRGLAAYVSVNKALVTRSSSVIPVIPLYVSILYKVMKERACHEDCIAQANRLFHERLYTGSPIPLDSGKRIRIDDYEMSEAVQAEVESRMGRMAEAMLPELADIAGFRDDFLRIHGFAVEGVDYLADCPVKGISIADFDLAAPVGGVGEESRT